jgi:hypothetical protein
MSFPDGAFYGVHFDKVLIHVRFLVQAATGSKAAPNLERWRERSHVPVLVHD